LVASARLFSAYDFGTIERLDLSCRIPSMNNHLPYPEKNRIETKQDNQGKKDVTPFADPKRILRGKWKQNV